MPRTQRRPHASESTKVPSTDGDSSDPLIAYLEAVTKPPRTRGRCRFCPLPEAAHDDLKRIVELKRDGKLPRLTLPKAWAYFVERHGFTYSCAAFRNHLYECMGVTWTR